jgi:hypothetical protein
MSSTQSPSSIWVVNGWFLWVIVYGLSQEMDFVQNIWGAAPPSPEPRLFRHPPEVPQRGCHPPFAGYQFRPEDCRRPVRRDSQPSRRTFVGARLARPVTSACVYSYVSMPSVHVTVCAVHATVYVGYGYRISATGYTGSLRVPYMQYAYYMP